MGQGDKVFNKGAIQVKWTVRARLGFLVGRNALHSFPA